MTTSRYCAMCDISYNDAPDSCPLCKTKQLLKMAEDEAVYYGEQLLIEQDRADKLETELEEKVDLLRSALTRLFDEATNSSNIYTHDGWSIRNPYVELPKDVEEQVREILRTTRKAETND